MEPIEVQTNSESKREVAPHLLPRLAERVFGTPLMVEPNKLEAILSVLLPRTGITQDQIVPLSEYDVPVAAYSEDRRDRKPYEVTSDGIGIIELSGSLVNRSSWMDAWSGMTSYERFCSELMDATTDPAIKGVMLRLDSPGGECAGVFDAADIVAECAKVKEVWASVDDMAFSAAYLLASQCKKIFVTKTGGVGSIGVIARHIDQSEMNKKIGVKVTFLFAGAHKKDMNPHEPLTDGAASRLQEEIDRLYGMFCQSVANGRKLSIDSVMKTEASLFFGENAVISGLADKVGTFRDAITQLTDVVTGKQSTKDSAAASATQLEGANMNEDVKTVPVAAAETAVAQEQTGAVADVAPVPVKEAKEETPVPAAIDNSAVLKAEQDREILDLCALMGKSASDANEFISKNMTPKQVRAELLKLKEEKGITGGTSTSIVGGSYNRAMQMASELRMHDSKLTKEQAIARVFKANPELYMKYLAENPAQTGDVQ